MQAFSHLTLNINQKDTLSYLEVTSMLTKLLFFFLKGFNPALFKFTDLQSFSLPSNYAIVCFLFTISDD